MAARRDKDFVVIARVEALIAGLGQEEATRRALAYELSLIHIYINGGRRGYLVGIDPNLLVSLLGAKPVTVALE